MLLDQYLSGSKKGKRCSAAVALAQMKADGNLDLYEAIDEWFYTPPGDSYSVSDVTKLLAAEGYPVGLQQVSAHRSAFTNRAGRYCTCTYEKVAAIIRAVAAEKAVAK